MKVGIVVPHIFMHRDILPRVIFSPAALALDLANGLQVLGTDVILFSPGPVNTSAVNVTADLSYFERELAGRSDSYVDLLKKHPFTFVTLARQVQSELIARAFTMANAGELDLIHVYTNEEDIALPFAQLCSKPVVFTHHDPFNFMIKYKNVFPKYKSLNWISISYAQRRGMPPDTNWIANVYHGLPAELLTTVERPANDYVAYIGRIIEPKGVHLAIQAVKHYNASHPDKQLKLKIAGKHYAGHNKDAYWQGKVLPYIDDTEIEYVGFVDSSMAKRDFIGNAHALLVPTIFEEPFGLVLIESLACGTPVVSLDSGAVPEVIDDGKTGFVARKVMTADGRLNKIATTHNLAVALENLDKIDRKACRQNFEARFTSERMCREHLQVYELQMEKPGTHTSN